MRKVIGKLTFDLYICVLLRITVFRSGWMWNEHFTGSIELVPFQTIFSYLKTGEYWEFFYLFFGNILWFVPLGCFSIFCGKKLWHCALFGLALSLSIEFFQYVFSTGFSEVEDVILNTLGAVLGGLLWMALRKFFEKQCKREQA